MTLSYYDVYRYRFGKNGTTHQEKEYNYGIQNFEKFLKEHPSVDTVIIDGVEERASIASNKQDQYKLTKEILTRITSKIHPGSLVQWAGEWWIVYQKELQPNQTYNSCYMIKCNEVVKWIDEYGTLREQHVYIFSSKDSMVKQNFRTWNRSITPQANQYLEMLIPTEPSIGLGQKFIITDRAWFVAEYDATSAPGVTYYSLTEDKIDRLDDDYKNKLANYKKQNTYQISLPEQINFQLGSEPIELTPVIYNGGLAVEENLMFFIKDSSIAAFTAENRKVKIMPISVGETELTMGLVNKPEVKTTIKIVVSEKEVENTYYIVGNDSIKVLDSATYSLHKLADSDTIVPIESFTISNTDLARGELREDGILIIYANENNKLGTITLTMTCEGKEFTKSISICALWGAA